jgi:hypothetical protein
MKVGSRRMATTKKEGSCRRMRNVLVGATEEKSKKEYIESV